MAIWDDFEITRTGGVKYTGSGTSYSTADFYKWMKDAVDDAEDDTLTARKEFWNDLYAAGLVDHDADTEFGDTK
jgi:hypothetical protein